VAKAVLFVCHANTARSVMAQLLLDRMLAARGAAGRVRVRSAGVAPWARDGMIVSLDARLALKEDGLLVAEDTVVSTALRAHPDLIAGADLIVTMTVEQKRIVGELAADGAATVLTLRELAGEAGDIGDPAGQGEDTFRACRDEIKRCLEKAIDRVLGEVP
jgi:protein-tyrosine-phosphatase